MKKFIEKEAGVINSADLKTAKGKAVYWLLMQMARRQASVQAM